MPPLQGGECTVAEPGGGACKGAQQAAAHPAVGAVGLPLGVVAREQSLGVGRLRQCRSSNNDHAGRRVEPCLEFLGIWNDLFKKRTPLVLLD